MSLKFSLHSSFFFLRLPGLWFSKFSGQVGTMAALFAPEQAGSALLHVEPNFKFTVPEYFRIPPLHKKKCQTPEKLYFLSSWRHWSNETNGIKFHLPTCHGCSFFLIFFAQEVKKAIEKAKVKSSDVSVAAVNGPKMTVISGRKDVVGKACGGWHGYSSFDRNKKSELLVHGIIWVEGNLSKIEFSWCFLLTKKVENWVTFHYQMWRKMDIWYHMECFLMCFWMLLRSLLLTKTNDFEGFFCLKTVKNHHKRADSDLCSGRSQKLQGLPVDLWRYHMPSIHHWCNQCWMISDKKWPRSPVAMGWVQGANFKLEVSIRHELDSINYLFPAFWMCSIDL